MSINKILAKSSGITLIEHSRNVEIVAIKVANKVLNNPNESKLEIIRVSALLHDIGKTNEVFQKLITGKRKKSNNKFTHNEIGWAFLYDYLNVSNNVLPYILNSVYWHHGISNGMCKHNHFDILKTVKESDIDNMKMILKELLGDDSVLTTGRGEGKFAGEISPIYYSEDNEIFNQDMVIYRTCLISADRLTSKLEEEGRLSDVDIELEKLLTKDYDFKVSDLDISKLDKNRFNIQVNISNECAKTTIVKAPAGFGKTLLGLIWASLSNKKLIWVTPTNNIAKAIYNSIIENMDSLGFNDLKIELLLSGEVEKVNHSDNSGFGSDIIVTNIDNFLSPTVKSKFADKLYLITLADVIFDEYHDLVTGVSLFSAFINMMVIRNRYTYGRTLLLSATQIPGLEKTWDSLGSQTMILPNGNNHYNAIHNKRYRFNISNEFEYNNSDTSTLLLFQSISQAQLVSSQFNFKDLIHSKFNKSDLRNKINNLFDGHGKNVERIVNNGSIIGTRILQTSLDISFPNLMLSVSSPLSTMQAIGRCNRWGDYDDSEVTIFKLRNKRENAVLTNLYEKELSDLWFDYLVKHVDGKELTLNEMYVIYNNFHSDNIKLVTNFLRDKYSESLKKLSTIYPYRTYGDSKTDILSAGSNKLRSNGDEIFYICKKHESPTYSDIFNTQIYNSISEDFSETGNIQVRSIGAMNTIIKQGDDRFSFGEIIENKKYHTIDGIRIKAKKSNTPYIVFDRVYHDDYGVIKHKLLEEIVDN